MDELCAVRVWYSFPLPVTTKAASRHRARPKPPCAPPVRGCARPGMRHRLWTGSPLAHPATDQSPRSRARERMSHHPFEISRKLPCLRPSRSRHPNRETARQSGPPAPCPPPSYLRPSYPPARQSCPISSAPWPTLSALPCPFTKFFTQ